MATAQETRSMELEGSLRAFKFPEILQFLGRGQMTGILSLRRDGEEVRVSFRDGHITGALSTVRTVRIGDMLLYAGRITRQALDEALEAQEASASSSPRFLGDILIQRGLVPQEDLRSFIELQVKEEVWDLFNWEDGSFRFEQSKVRKASAIDVKLDVEPLLLEGSRRLDEWQVIRSNIGGGREVFRVNPDLAGPPEVDLDMNTWRILSLVNGRLTVDSIVRISNFGKFDTYYALDSLLRAGIIVNVQDGSSVSMNSSMTSGHSRAGRSAGVAPGSDIRENRPAGENRGGATILGLFGRRKNAAVEDAQDNNHAEAVVVANHSQPQDFVSDVSVACAAVNLLAETLAASSGFHVEGEPSDWLQQLWRETEQRYPRADLVRLEGNRLASTRYDRYAKLEGSITDSIRGCHEDCLEALRGFWFLLLDRARERMDAGLVDRIGEQCLQSLVQVRPAIGAPEFSISRWKRQRR